MSFSDLSLLHSLAKFLKYLIQKIIVIHHIDGGSTFAHIFERMWFICAHNFPR